MNTCTSVANLIRIKGELILRCTGASPFQIYFWTETDCHTSLTRSANVDFGEKENRQSHSFLVDIFPIVVDNHHNCWAFCNDNLQCTSSLDRREMIYFAGFSGFTERGMFRLGASNKLLFLYARLKFEISIARTFGF